MAVIFQPWLSRLVFFVFLVSAVPLSHCQFGSPQNIETFYPFDAPSPAPAPNFPSNPPSVIPSLPANPPILPSSPQLSPPKSSSKRRIAVIVAATAGSTLVFSVLLFCVINRFIVARRGTENGGTDPNGGRPAVPPDEFTRFDGDLKGFIVDENGLDVLYWRKLGGKDSKKSFHKEVFQGPKIEEREGMILYDGSRRKSEPRQEVPLLRGKSSTSHVKVVPGDDDPNRMISLATIAIKDVEKPEPPPPAPPPPPPIPAKKTPAAPPPPPPIPAKKTPAAPPPPPPKAGSVKSSLKPPPAPPKGRPDDNKPGEPSSGTGNGQVKMKALHWDKVNTNTDHSMVWDKIDGGSFRFDGDLMEHLFGYVAATRISPQRNGKAMDGSSSTSNPRAQTQIFILDPRRSQNTAIVLKSLSLSRQGILDALDEGQGLETDTLEKLARISPTEEERSQILEYEGDHTRLADAEAFLYHLLKAVPSAFTRIKAMLFRLNYDSEILQLKESIQTLELGCKELRTRGRLFMKLLEAILKAGNRMNAGTARGNAQAFNLNALRKLSDVKSTDGRTTLLHFVVEEVVRSEGKRCAMNRNSSFGRSSSRGSKGSSNAEGLTPKEEREKEYKMLGLPIVGGLSAEFSNVKKAATIEYDAFASMNSALTARAADIRQIVSQCATDIEGGFVREMKGFLEEAEGELKILGEEQTSVMELVKRTAEYYQAGASKDKRASPLQLFVIVNDFLDMVDHVCIEISRKLQRKTLKTTLGSSSPKSPPRTTVRFPNLPENFMSDKSSSSSESDKF